jgi:hypothetical protein
MDKVQGKQFYALLRTIVRNLQTPNITLSRILLCIYKIQRCFNVLAKRLHLEQRGTKLESLQPMCNLLTGGTTTNKIQCFIMATVLDAE